MQCVLLSGVATGPNAADGWIAFFEQIQDMEFPQDDSQWTSQEREGYEQLLPLIQQARELALNRTCDWNLDYSADPNTKLTHLNLVRKASRLIQYSI